jgi:ADP-ribose pyrophosphatase YjhB (NUDIX family)
MTKKILAGGGLVINEKNEILFIYRRQKWDLPKGKLNIGEKIEECAVREVMEETGIKNLTMGNLLVITTHTYQEKGVSIQKETHWFSMNATTLDNPIFTPQLEEDIEKIEWVSSNKIEEYLANSYKTIRLVLSAWNRASNDIG